MTNAVQLLSGSNEQIALYELAYLNLITDRLIFGTLLKSERLIVKLSHGSDLIYHIVAEDLCESRQTNITLDLKERFNYTCYSITIYSVPREIVISFRASRWDTGTAPI